MFGYNLRPYLRQYAIVITVNLGMLSIGLSLGWSSPVLVKLKNGTESRLTEPMTDADVSWIVSGGFLASIFATFLPSVLLDSLGRKFSLLLSYIPHIVACVLFMVATKAWQLILGRVLVGIGFPVVYAVTSTYAAEIASKETRGALGTLLQISCCIGVLIMLSVGPFVSYLSLSTMYTSIVVLAAVPSLFLPESPYLLYSKGKTDEAMELLIRLRGSETLAKLEIEEYKLADHEKNVEKWTLLKDFVFLKTVALVSMFGVLGQLSGASALTYYLQSILESTKTNVSSEVASAVVGTIKVVSTLFTASITDTFGRKPIMIWTWIGKSIGMIGLGTYFYEKHSDMNAFVNYIPVLCIMLVVFCHNAGQNSLFFVIIGELFEGPSRAIGVTSSIFATCISNFLMAMYLESALKTFGPSTTYWCFGVICALSVWFYQIFLPETKGKTFAEIQKKLGRKR